MFDGKGWQRVPPGGHVYSLRGSTHRFLNCGTTVGRIECTIVPGGLERYLEALSVFSMPQDAKKVMELSAEYGILFVTAPDNIVTPI